MDDALLRLMGNLAVQSLLAIGGIYVVLGELHRVVVVENGWLTNTEFTSLFALAQASPGPNTLFVTLIGWRMAGIPGALMATAAFVFPAVLLAGTVARAWTRWAERRWFLALQRGLVPLTLGLIASSALLLSLAATSGAASYALLAVAAGVSLATRMPPVVILLAAAGFGALLPGLV